MACPYFMPMERLDDGAWMHPARLPLGAGWTGHCTAPGHEGETPSGQQIRDCCNLGYASTCSFRPGNCLFDSIRFAVMRESDELVVICYACEKNHRPGGAGRLEYERGRGWLQPHPDTRIQKMAECYLESYFLRKTGAILPSTASS